MSHLLIAASRDRMEPVIRELYAHHVFHIRTFVEGEDNESEGLHIGTPLPEGGASSGALVKVRSLESVFGLIAEDIQPTLRQTSVQIRDAIDRELPALGTEVEEQLARRVSLEGALKDHEQAIKELAPFSAAPIPLELYHGYENLKVFAGKIAKDVAIPVPNEKHFSAGKDGTFIAVFVRVQDWEKVEPLLTGAGFSPLAIPMGKGLPSALIEEHSREIARANEEIGRIAAQLEGINVRQKEFLAACEELLTMDVERAEAPLRFATTDQAFLVEGWAPTAEVDRLKSALALATEGKSLVAEIKDEHHPAKAPVEYDNPAFSRSTQLFMDVYSRPRYDELDPTIFVSIIFPIFFGIILGDVGYGLVLLVISLALRKYITSRDGRYLLDVMRNGSITSIIFGVLFSEFFGFSFSQLGIHWEPVLFARHLNIGGEAGAHGGGPDITGLLLFAIWIGILQITLGRVLSAVNHYRHHGIRGLLPQLGWIATMWGILLGIWSIAPLPLMPNLTGFPPVAFGFGLPMILGGVLILGGIIAIASESALELIEIPTIISHTMSYARLVAVGLSSVAIAMVVNFIAIGMLIEPQLAAITPLGIVLILVGVVVLIGGHLGNTALGMVGGGLQ
ncbi:MAG: V-type ATP synthase subunit I, partial [Methanomicrobiales archaeon]|nr:V-type ATP synthase subunit I [Methanomicrobiales archaeon]